MKDKENYFGPFPQVPCLGGAGARVQLEADFEALYLKGNYIAALVAINRPKDIAVARRVMQKKALFNAERLSRTDNIQEVLRAALAS